MRPSMNGRPQHYSAARIAGHRRPSRLRRSASSGRRSSVQPNTVPPRSERRPSSAQSPSSARRSNGPRPSSGRRNTVLRSSVLAEQRAAEQQVAEQRAAEERAAEQQAAEQRAAEEPAAQQAASSDWQPAPAEGQWIPAGMPGSNWTAPAAENGSSGEYVGRRRAAEPAMSTPPAEPRTAGRHSAPADATDPGRPQPPHAATAGAHRRSLSRPARLRKRPHRAIAVLKRSRVRTRTPPADTPSPSCWPEWEAVRREAAVAAAAKSELVS